MNKIRTILLVEDRDDDVELARRALARSGMVHTLAVVRDGQEALDYLGRSPDLPAIMLLDINLPRVGGMDVLRQVRDNPKTRRLPVVILTTSNEEHDVAEGYDLGANSYVRKPVDFGHFVDVLGRIGLYWLGINEPPA